MTQDGKTRLVAEDFDAKFGPFEPNPATIEFQSYIDDTITSIHRRLADHADAVLIALLKEAFLGSTKRYYFDDEEAQEVFQEFLSLLIKTTSAANDTVEGDKS